MPSVTRVLPEALRQEVQARAATSLMQAPLSANVRGIYAEQRPHSHLAYLVALATALDGLAVSVPDRQVG